MQAEQTAAAARAGWRTVNGLRLHTLEWGDPTSPLLLLLHGNGSLDRTWERSAPHFANRFHVVAPTQRGFGESDWDADWRYGVTDFASDALALVNQLGVDQFDLIGHSLGGVTALLIASENQQRVKHLILADSIPKPDAGARGAATYDTGMPITFADEASFFAFGKNRYRRGGEEPTQERLRRLLSHELKPTPDGGYTWKRDMLGMVKSRERGEPMFDVELGLERLANLRVPVMLCHGEGSPTVGREAVAAAKARQPRLELVEIKGAGHEVHRDNVPQFVEVVNRFLSS
jgi:pimeloyl-ACP methyl ester carboxylesterase